MFEDLTPHVAALMREAARTVILPRFRALSATDITTKAVDDVVTVADRESERLLSAGLARLLPEAAIVGEEAAHDDPSLLDRLSDGLCWIVDPLDGTNNYAAGKPPFGIIVALSQAGRTRAGWLYDPLRDRLCHAAADGGAWINGDRITARESASTPPVAAISLVFMDPERREAVRRGIAPHYRLVDIPRCAAEQYPRLVLGENDVSVFERTLPWDHAAGVLFLNEAGGMAARPDGGEYRVDDHARPGLIGAASPAQWHELAARMADL